MRTPDATDFASLNTLLNLTRRCEIVDIGANPVDDIPPYLDMLRAGHCNVLGFEPQEDARQRLMAAKGPHERYLPYAVGDGGSHTLHVYRSSGLASLLELEPATLKVFDRFQYLGELQEKIPVDTRRLDDVEEITDIDMLKIDIQGGELAVLQHGKKALAETLVIHTEVSFVNLYKNQPSFGEVDLELRAQGFIPHCLVQPLLTRPITPTVYHNNPMQGQNQLLDNDIVYVRDFRAAESWPDEWLKRLAMLALCCYGSLDLVGYCLTLLQQRQVISPSAYIDFVQNRPW